MIHIGVDPGQAGGLAALRDSEVISNIVMPMAGKRVDFDVIATWLNDLISLVKWPSGDDIVSCIEKVHTMPKQGVASSFKFGFSTGGVYGVFAAFQLPLHEVTPQLWKKTILYGTPKDKDAAIEYVRRVYPTVDLLRTPRCKKLHDGMAEAICIAEYARAALNT